MSFLSRQDVSRLYEPAPASSFPTVAEICRAAVEAGAERNVFERMQAPFAYLSDSERHAQRDCARLTTRITRAWLFDEEDVVAVKQRLAVRRGEREAANATPPSLPQFCSEYMALLAESCVLQRRVAEVLSRRDANGRCMYVSSVDDARSRPDRERLLGEALQLFLEVYRHEQERFAYGSSLKDLILREMVHYPSETHQLLLTSTRGDFWTRYEDDLLACFEDPTEQNRRHLAAMYFNGDEQHLQAELARIAELPRELVVQRRDEHRKRQARLQLARIKKGYARLGDLPSHRVRFSRDANRNIGTIDQLLWIDNVLEKVLDHKMLLQHDLYLRLHLARLIMACAPFTDWRELAAESPAAASRKEELSRLEHMLGEEAGSFAVSDTVLSDVALRVYLLVASVTPRRRTGSALQPEMVRAA